MHQYLHFLAAALATLCTGSLAHPARPIVRHLDHVQPRHGISRQVHTNGFPATVTSATTRATIAGGGFQLKLTNEAADKMYAHIMGTGPNGNMVFLDSTGSSWHDATTSTGKLDSSAISIDLAGKATKTLTLPSHLNSGRIYIGAKPLEFSESGTSLVEPSPMDSSLANYKFPWGIVELDYGDKLVANPSYVDSVGIALGFTITAADGTVYEDPGLPAGALKTICNKLEAVSEDWGSLCLKDDEGVILRALAPEKAPLTGKLETLYDDYIEQVWTKFQSSTLTINTEYTGSGSPNVTCRVQASNETLVCTQPDGAVFNYAKPTTADVLGCNSGPFRPQGANTLQAYTWPRLCAAFTRATLLLDGGDVTPSAAIGREKYYTGDVVNEYAKVVHETLTQKTGDNVGGAYAFAYDDVDAPGTGENESGTITVESEGAVMEIFIRGT